MNEQLAKIINLIKLGAEVLTVNKRLSRYLVAEFSREMERGGLGAWPTPVVMPLGNWVERVWSRMASYGTGGKAGAREPYLSPARTEFLWRKVVEEDEVFTSGRILLAKGAAQTSFDAYMLISEYCVRSLGDDIYLTDEARAFKRWLGRYRAALKKTGFIDYPAMIERAVECIRRPPSGAAQVPGRVVLAGFDELRPFEAELTKALEGRGVEVDYWPYHIEPRADPLVVPRADPLASPRAGQTPEAGGPPSDTPIDTIETGGVKPNLRLYDDETEEVRQAARWARATHTPGTTTGFIVPDLARYRERIVREFASELNPRSAVPWESVEEVFNISLGPPLAEEGVVRIALDILSIGLEGGDMDINIDTPIDTLAQVLLSPYIGVGEGEYLALAGLEADLRDRGVMGISLAGLGRVIERAIGRADMEDTAGPAGPADPGGGGGGGGGSGERAGRLKGFKRLLDFWSKELSKGKRKELPSFWAASFARLLKGLGWPRGRIGLDSREYQAVSKWHELLEAFASLDALVNRMDRVEAVGHLTAMANDTLHQPETRECPIQVLGTLEARGLFFDRVWVMGAHEECLPGAPSPNPFLMIELQKRFNMPGSSPEERLKSARAFLKRVFESAPQIEVSCPKRVDEKEVGPSPLIIPLADVQVDAVTMVSRASSRLLDAVHDRCEVEVTAGDEKVPITPEELASISKSTAILKDQSACPFRAFALHRLGSREIAVPAPGFDPSQRGTLAHNAMRNFWREVKDSKGLKDIIEKSELDSYIDRSVREAVEGYSPGRRQPAKYLDLEKERIAALVKAWLDVEAKRVPFTVIEVEGEREIEIEGLSIAARIDRIDRLKGGEEVIIDYKTGPSNKGHWLPGRPKEPQLLLYNMSGEFDAIAFASLRLKDTRFVGTSSGEGLLPGVKSFESLKKDKKWSETMEGVATWQDLRERWQETLVSLARGFIEGEAGVDPNGELAGRDHPCTYCGLTVFCRRYELGITPGVIPKSARDA